MNPKPLSFRTKQCFFATEVEAECENGHVSKLDTPSSEQRRYHIPVGPDGIIPDKKNWKRGKAAVIDHDINILMALAMYLSGDGATEMSRLASVLGCKNHSCIINNCDKVTKDYLHQKIIELTDKVIPNDLLIEAKESIKIQYPDCWEELWPHFHASLTSNDPKDETINEKIIELVAGIDMGWQKRSSGKRYDSPSGHMFLVGGYTGKIIRYHACFKFCAKCMMAQKRGIEPALHNCVQNYTGSSKGMEAHSALELVKEVWYNSNGLLRMGMLIADDDSTMKRYCSHGKKGHLPKEIPPPIFKADPAHRVKNMTKDVFKLAHGPKYKSPINPSEAKRIKFYTSYFVREYRLWEGMTGEMMAEQVPCVIDHLFDDHSRCIEKFCWRYDDWYKREILKSLGSILLPEPSKFEPLIPCYPEVITVLKMDVDKQGPNTVDCNLEKEDFSDTDSIVNEESEESSDERDGSKTLDSIFGDIKKQRKRKKGYFLDKWKDAVKYKQMKECLAKHCTPEKMEDLIHSYDTQKNESLNMSMMQIVNKHRNLSRTNELLTRIAFLVGCNNIGKYEYIKRLLPRLNISVEDNRHFLEAMDMIDKKRERKRKRESQKETKLSRSKDDMAKRVEENRKAQKDYQKGMYYGDAKPNVKPTKEDKDVDPTAKSKKKRKETDTTKKCELRCYGCIATTPHSSARSSNCLFHHLYEEGKNKGQKNATEYARKIVKSKFRMLPKFHVAKKKGCCMQQFGCDSTEGDLPSHDSPSSKKCKFNRLFLMHEGDMEKVAMDAKSEYLKLLEENKKKTYVREETQFECVEGNLHITKKWTNAETRDITEDQIQSLEELTRENRESDGPKENLPCHSENRYLKRTQEKLDSMHEQLNPKKRKEGELSSSEYMELMDKCCKFI